MASRRRDPSDPLTVRGGYHGDTVGAMSVCDLVTGVHRIFRDYVAQQLFVDPTPTRLRQAVQPGDLDQSGMSSLRRVSRSRAS